MKKMKLFVAVILLTGIFYPTFAKGRSEAKTVPSGSQKVVVASTSWTAAIAVAAGAKDVKIIAPLDLRHPPEYELKPTDLQVVSGADFVIYAGFERFAEKLTETAGSANVKLVKVETVNSPEVLKASAKEFAALLGTQAEYEAWAKNFDALTAELKQKILAAYPDRRAVVQRMLLPYAQWLGLEIVGEFGPAEPSPALILDLVRLKPALIIDNYHNPSGKPVADTTHAPYADIINFPGRGNTRTLEDVFRYNADLIIKAAAK